MRVCDPIILKDSAIEEDQFLVGQKDSSWQSVDTIQKAALALEFEWLALIVKQLEDLQSLPRINWQFW